MVTPEPEEYETCTDSMIQAYDTTLSGGAYFATTSEKVFDNGYCGDKNLEMAPFYTQDDWRNYKTQSGKSQSINYWYYLLMFSMQCQFGCHSSDVGAKCARFQKPVKPFSSIGTMSHTRHLTGWIPSTSLEEVQR